MQPLPQSPQIQQNSKDNTFSQEKAALGKLLFFERRLSKSQQIACASCHNAELAFGDGLSTSFGHNRAKGRRNSPNIALSSFFEPLFWDGRADSLESQALMPITDPLEMANDLDSMVETLQNTPQYYAFFILAFGDSALKSNIIKYYPTLFELDSKKVIESRTLKNGELAYKNLDSINLESVITKATQKITLMQNPNIDSMPFLTPKMPLNKTLESTAKSLINAENIAKAIATFERTLTPKNTRFNAFLQGNKNALSDKEIYGLHIFRTSGRCMNCHYGAALSDGKFHNIGLSFYGRKLQDLGRYEITRDPSDVGAFKTPSLIQVAKSAPYMHNGIFPHLAGVLNMYNAGFPFVLPKEIDKNDPLIPHTTPLIKPLNLTKDELSALESFLKTL
ncbi:cytochrome-c peroxidase [Helicobacter saguini]|uniref:Cytochrome-c peroxidase n=2 Tax=Helicobacter saguini TaxID=1548018 RepID=A0A347VMT4_9HELI|nr:cytochrome-c peroxidase [Helicobacter saguini]MWV67612.1 cytochrome-c peroxidase [Helicobacter saguini]MWV69963.1 cytochrome-c peroxidase [Helicobacter saguini]MWV72823.1 cytochrome-c peroxidase [Helicobacter saguini]TLD92394.1 cytochrome-c peroxidase [Helicobacter saguini]